MIGLITVYPIVSNSIIINISIMIGLMEFIPEYHPLFVGFTTLEKVYGELWDHSRRKFRSQTSDNMDR